MTMQLNYFSDFMANKIIKKNSVATFRLSTGHDCLAKHLHRIGILQLPYCTLCKEQEDMDRTHIMKCSVLRKCTDHERYWEARGLMIYI